MAINMKQGGDQPGLDWCATAQPGVVSIRIRGADVATAKGSALASGDVVDLMDIPALTAYGFGTINVITPDSGTTVTVEFGATNADEFIAAGALAGSAGIVAEGTGAFDLKLIAAAADVLALTLTTITAGEDDWEIDVLVELTDYTGNPRARSAKDVP